MLPDQTLTDRDWYLDELYCAWRAASAEADAAAEQLASEHARREGHGKGRSMHPVYAGSRSWN